MNAKKTFCLIILVTLMAALPHKWSWAEDGFKAVQSKIGEHTLDNGLKFIILPRREAPVISFHTYVDVGSVNERPGVTGLAHMFEHLAFKGTKIIGTRDYEREQAALKKVDELYLKLRAEQSKGPKADPNKVQQLEKEVQRVLEEASKLGASNEFGEIIEQAGGVGLNAFTTADSTQYFLSLPSNKLELWMSLESDRFLNPVLRDFYKERDVVKEERRFRVENDPFGKLLEQFLSTAYRVHPYGWPTIGFMKDLDNLTRADATKFFKTYYIPRNMIIAVVGDVDPAEVIRLAQVYFGRLSNAPKPAETVPEEPPQKEERRFVLKEQSQPMCLIGYHKPSIKDKDEAVFDAITDILGIGRTSRLYRSLVVEKKVATLTQAFTGFPGNKYPGLFLFYILPAPGSSNEKVEKAVDEEVEKLKTQLVDEITLKRVKTRAKASLLRELNSNSGMAQELTSYQALLGTWRALFDQLDKINSVTAEDIKRVSNTYLRKNNRTVGFLEPATNP